MSEQTPPRPLNVPTLTEVIDALAPPPPTADVPTLLLEPASVVGQLSAASDPLEGADVPRSLLKATQATPPVSGATPTAVQVGSPVALDAARASLSEALRSARDGRWAPMPNVELPTLTVEAEPEAPSPVAPALAIPAVGPEPLSPMVQQALPEWAAGPVEVTEVTEAQLAHRVLSVVQKQIDGMIDYRLREAMSPILQRHADALVRELRDELKQTMQDVIGRAVAQEMAKVRPR